FCPRERAIVEWDDLHVPRRLARFRRNTPYRFSFDADFPRVVAHCALNRLGRAHSVEVWEGEELVGGIYGVDAGGAFAGESMFYLRPNASKLAFLHLFEHLHSRGLDWIDIQVMTPHMQRLGAKLVTRDVFLTKLHGALARGLELFPKAGVQYHPAET
ncbi:MAG: leucyl/phenylalanyl-tRNA--protein transferase, partial [Acidobacteriota bacterium]|nr:leucyl/phenylalanyl-tRNA--protein transferase [Acidobacteriota bacterium]